LYLYEKIIVEIHVFWNVTLYRWMNDSKSFERTYCLHRQGLMKALHNIGGNYIATERRTPEDLNLSYVMRTETFAKINLVTVKEVYSYLYNVWRTARKLVL